MNSIPKTTKFTLKRIVEALSQIPSNGGMNNEPVKLTPEQKMQLQEMAASFDKFGECLQNEEAIIESAKNLSQLCELASQYAMNECGDYFQQEILKKDTNELKKRISEYNKVARECYAKHQQLKVGFDDIKHIMERYYNLKGNDFNKPQPLQTEVGKICPKNEDLNRVCMYCKKNYGKTESVETGDSHGICPECLENMQKEFSPAMRRAFDSVKTTGNHSNINLDKSF